MPSVERQHHFKGKHSAFVRRNLRKMLSSLVCLNLDAPLTPQKELLVVAKANHVFGNCARRHPLLKDTGENRRSQEASRPCMCLGLWDGYLIKRGRRQPRVTIAQAHGQRTPTFFFCMYSGSASTKSSVLDTASLPVSGRFVNVAVPCVYEPLNVPCVY
jgi:hypothetical protein